MTCDRFLALLDALPRAEWTAGQRDAMGRHAGECARCRSAMAAAGALESSWNRWPEPAAPSALAPAVMARVHRHEIQRLEEEPDSARSAAAQPAKRGAWTRRLAWAAAAAGSVIGLGTQVYSLLAAPLPLDLGSLGIGAWSAVVRMSQWTLFVPAGLLLYLLGLFTLLRPDEHSSRRRG